MKNDALARQLGFDIDELDEELSSTLFRIHVDTFRDIFIPMFKNPEGNHFGAWSHLIGGPTKRVNLVDDNGDIVAVVPPVLTGQGFVSQEDGFNLNNIVRRAVLLRNSLPGRSANEFNKMMKELTGEYNTHHGEWAKLISSLVPNELEEIDEEDDGWGDF